MLTLTPTERFVYAHAILVSQSPPLGRSTSSMGSKFHLPEHEQVPQPQRDWKSPESLHQRQGVVDLELPCNVSECYTVDKMMKQWANEMLPG